jgi:hypothetical protein
MSRVTTGRFGFPVHGFDTDVPLSAKDALVMRGAGYSFALRYIRRSLRSSKDLSWTEIQSLHNAGLAVMPVQHVESESSWTPLDDKGRLYGSNAALACAELGIPGGTTVWLDLEGVDPKVASEDVIHYCNWWYGRVEKAGYQPGIYIGWRCGIGAEALYKRLKFTRYWASYNLNSDEYPITRGVCMQQGRGAAPSSAAWLDIDTDVIRGDMLGGYPSLYVPDEWDPQ